MYVARLGDVCVAFPAMILSRAGEGDRDAIVGLVKAASEWLRCKDTDQWSQPWPSEAEWNPRILRDLAAGVTWIVRDNRNVVATITGDSEDDPIWPLEWQRDLAVYVRRLIVSRDRAGRGLGAALLDWAGLTALRGYGARWTRVGVWSTNQGLLAYYRRQGFMFCGTSTDPVYPSGALFQKSTDQLREPRPPLFQEV